MPMASAEMQSTVTGPDLRVIPTSVQKMTGPGQVTTLPVQDGQAGNFRVDVGIPGLSEFYSELLTYGDDYLTYRHTAQYDVVFNGYTMSKQEDVVTKQDWNQEWMRYRMYEIDGLNSYFDSTPGHDHHYIGNWAVGSYPWPYPVPATEDVNLWKAGEKLSFKAPKYTLNTGLQPSYIDYYRNLKFTIGIAPPSNITLHGEGNSTVSMSCGLTDWQVNSAWAGEGIVQPIGAYQVEFAGYDNNHISLDLSYTHEVNSVQLSDDLAESAVAAQLSHLGGVTFERPYKATLQNYQQYALAKGKSLINMPGNPSQPVEVVLPIETRPQVDYYNQQVTVGRVGKGTPLDIRTKCDLLGMGPAITGSTSVDTEYYDRWVQVYAQNYVIQQHVFFQVIFYSRVQLAGMTSEALLGIPEWTQGDIIADLAISGDGGKAIKLLSNYGLGSFLSDAQTVTSSLLGIAAPILIIIGIAIAMYVFVKVGIPAMSRKHK